MSTLKRETRLVSAALDQLRTAERTTYASLQRRNGLMLAANQLRKAATAIEERLQSETDYADRGWAVYQLSIDGEETPVLVP
jgi:hypothetical protein